MRIVALFLLFPFFVLSQSKYTHADSLKGKITKEREWWNVLHYELHASFNAKDSSVSGVNKTTYKVLSPLQIMHIDLREPMILDSAIQNNKKCGWKKDGDAYFINLSTEQKANEQNQITFYFHGKPKAAKLPPWDGGLIWKKDKNKNPWISIACQGMAGSVWFPNKDHMYDEPDSVSFFITAPNDLVAVAGGKLRSTIENNNGTKTWNWAIVNPINNYSIIPYIGKYLNFKDTLNGEGGVLDINYWVLDYNLEKAKEHFKETKTMLRCFENWFGKYPFYEDGFKLVEAPHLGMEHQSAVAYGNNYVKGYMGRDLSGTGWGLKWDFIIVHESGHEWFGNNISVKDVADNWVHEGFTSYSEALYTEYLFGKEAGADYVIGTRKGIDNDKPIIGDYEVNRDGSGDMYNKAANMLHTIRQLVNNDSLWKSFLRDINKTFWHTTTTSKEVETYMINYLKLDLTKVFDQYLRTTQIPTFEYYWKDEVLSMRWTNCVPGFNMPVRINIGNNSLLFRPSEKWNSIGLPKQMEVSVNRNFYVNIKKSTEK
ncbi:MAG: M1 family metallopeptidase [Bacteroidia bacterium]|nr:M1 family metallopeptidase [Bacteroidia bacterium]